MHFYVNIYNACIAFFIFTKLKKNTGTYLLVRKFRYKVTLIKIFRAKFLQQTVSFLEFLTRILKLLVSFINSVGNSPLFK